MTNQQASGTKKRRLWRGLSAISAALLTLFITLGAVIDGYRTDIDKFLGTQSIRIVSDAADDDQELYTFLSDYSNTTELLDAIENLGERMSEEGSVLLKNNGALPLDDAETSQITLLGFSSYSPSMGGTMGSSLTANQGTDADTVDMVQAFENRGFSINPVVEQMYVDLKDQTTAMSIMPWGMAIPFPQQVAPSTTGLYVPQEPSVSVLDQSEPRWRSSLEQYTTYIVTLGRGAGENANYPVGPEGVDPQHNFNQNDPLGLSDLERDIIEIAKQAARENGGKVIVLLNNASAMEIQELKLDDGIDAILQIGFPGGYGFYGVADILSGAANPSGRLTATYATVNANSAAAQNYGNYMYTNAEPDLYFNAALVEAENIYIGYKYYETRYADSVLGQGNADSGIGSSTDGSWSYENEVSYPFGFGLSYTSFEQNLESISVDLARRSIQATVRVTNTGEVAGKDAVQLYVSLPYTEYDRAHQVEKAAIQLIDYEKTDVLAPGASQLVTISADAQDMASWDSSRSNAAGTNGNFILDAGEYYFAIGNGAHDALNNVLSAQGKSVADGMTAEGHASMVKSWSLAELDDTSFARTQNGTPVENQLADMDLNYWMPNTVTYLSRSDWAGTWPKTYKDLTANAEMLAILDNDIYEITDQGDPNSVVFGADNGLTLADLKGVDDLDDPRWELLMDQLSLEEAMIRTGFGGTSTKPIESITSPEVVQNDGPNGYYSYPLGQYANTDESSTDPYTIDSDDPNSNYKFGTMANATVIAQTFNKEMAAEYGALAGNYSIWSNLTILWGAGTNLHRVPYNARNHEYYSEDPILSAEQAAAFVAAGKRYGAILSPKHFAFNDTEVNRTGISVFMTEQQARENELRGTQAVIEDAKAIGAMTAFNRIGVYPGNAHRGLLINILRDEWGFQGLMSEDFIRDTSYSVLKEAVYSGVTMTCNTGENSIAAVTEKWDYWKPEAVGEDAQLLEALRNVMTWQAFAIANSNAMDGLSSSSSFVQVNTWYDNALIFAQLLFAVLTLAAIVIYLRQSKSTVDQ